MKTSYKLLVLTAGVLIALLITGLMILRNDIQSLDSLSELKTKYESVVVDNFEKLDFSAHWIVNIRQGREYSVELAAEENSGLKPVLENRDGTLYFISESIYANDSSGIIYAKITAPELIRIKAVNGAKIYLKGFETDSLQIILENGATFTGEENLLTYTTFDITGGSLLQLTDDPFK